MRVTYDLARLNTCRRESDNTEVWVVTGFAQFDDGTQVTLALSQLSAGKVVPSDAELVLPASASHVALWFTVTNEFGCIGYDSNEGANYQFDLQPHQGGATLTFAADPSVAPTQSGPIHAGDHVVVHYEPDRLSQCYALANELPAWNVTAHWQVDGSAAQTVPATRIDGSQLVASDPTITIPHGSGLTFWFEATSVYGCDAFDSAYGANYHFAIQ